MFFGMAKTGTCAAVVWVASFCPAQADDTAIVAGVPLAAAAPEVVYVARDAALLRARFDNTVRETALTVAERNLTVVDVPAASEDLVVPTPDVSNAVSETADEWQNAMDMLADRQSEWIGDAFGTASAIFAQSWNEFVETGSIYPDAIAAPEVPVDVVLDAPIFDFGGFSFFNLSNGGFFGS